MSPLAALQTATLNPGKYFGKNTSGGRVAAGQPADLVLLEENPLDDISNTRRIQAVVLNGRLLNRTDLNQLLAEVRAAAPAE